MSNRISTYSFLPWLRQGIANQITAGDLDPGVTLRATINVQLQLTGEGVEGSTLSESISKDVQLFGPGDIVGIDSKAIIKIEPRNWITNFEPNYLPYIDFYDEAFPWRYTPAAPDKALHRLRPWIMLVVLDEDEFKEGTNIQGKPLPFIEVTDTATDFPPAEQLWAWAHVHVNRDLAASADEIISADMNAVLPEFQAVLNQDPDLAYSRIVCPRKLEANTAYHAFLIPVFESGRLAGLGLDPENTPHATFSAWADYPSKETPQLFPYYYRWYFRTGMVGDFEYLVRLLEPKPVGSRVGRRDMDVQDPDPNLPGITDAELGGVLKLGGALQVPFEMLKDEEQAEVLKYENWDQPYPHDFQKDLAEFINLADEYAVKSAQQAHSDTDLDEAIQTDPDPLITPPLYGKWHALTQRLLKDREGNALSQDDNWVHELNLDPRFRVAAGFGTGVVQKNQEEYMNAAWEQIGDVLEANRKIRLAQLAKEVSAVWHERHLVPLQAVNAERAFLLTTPVQKRVVAQGFTVYHQVNTSVVPYAVTSTAARRVLRPGGRMMKVLEFSERVQPDNLIARINAGEVAVAPPKTVPEGVVTVKDVADSLLPKNAPSWIVDWLRQFPWLKYVALLVAFLILLLLVLFGSSGLWLAIGGLVAVASLYLSYLFSNWSQEIERADSLLEENQTPESVDELPKSPDFVLAEPGDGFTPTRGDSDSPEAVRFKAALKDAYTLLGASHEAAAQPPKGQLDLPVVTDAVIQAIDPQVTIPRRTFLNIQLPEYLIELIGEQFKEAMAYPEFDTPMYKPLVDISTELFLPNINYVEQNSISLLETNQKFIEAYMVGLNHEFARELLWREYPTDQRGSYFRQFWDASGFLDAKRLGDEELREKLKDIPPLHRWSRFSNLGDHDHREERGDKEEEVVLVIRGELLKKYPTAVIYAHRAEWQRTNGSIDNAKERLLVELTEAEEENPPRTKVKTPLYEAKVEPDIYFFGFDLTAAEARGDTGENEGDDPGWFFVIKERPGESRFGLDISREGGLYVWNDLSWEDVLPGAQAGSFIEIDDATPTIVLDAPLPEDEKEKEEQREDDQDLQWNKNMSSAELAYILYQAPVMVAVHAAEMLPRE